MDFIVSADHRVKTKKMKRVKYTEHARELKKLCNIKVTVIPIVVGTLGTIPKDFGKEGQEELEIGGGAETIQTTALLRSARILGRVQKTWGDLLTCKLL